MRQDNCLEKLKLISPSALTNIGNILTEGMGICRRFMCQLFHSEHKNLQSIFAAM